MSTDDHSPVKVGTLVALMAMPGDDWQSVKAPTVDAGQAASAAATSSTTSAAPAAASITGSDVHHIDPNMYVLIK